VLKVNGVAISELELAMETRRGHGAEDSTASRDQIIEGLVLKEVMAQKAVALGLDRDPGLAERMERVEAQRASQRRKELANLFYKHEILDKVTATEQEAKALYDKDQARIRTEVHVAQILARDEAEAARALKDLQAGQSFDEVAARGYPSLPEGIKPPWDLGFLKWKNIPHDWQPALAALAPGQISSVIKGPGNRFWIIKLLEKRDSAQLTFARVKADLLDELKASKAQALRDRIERELLSGVKVEKLDRSWLAAPAVPATQPQTARRPAAGHAFPARRDDS
jgi:peptidyl-prolyl cis-trans isomerase C